MTLSGGKTSLYSSKQNQKNPYPIANDPDMDFYLSLREHISIVLSICSKQYAEIRSYQTVSENENQFAAYETGT